MEWLVEGRPARGSLLFVNGRGDFIEKYLEAYSHWHQEGWHVAAFDWRGQGGSRAEGDEEPDFDAMIGDLEEIAARWQAKKAGPHVAIAHSMGAHLLLRALASGGLTIRAAVLVAPMININTSPLPAWLARGVASFLCRLGRGSGVAWRAASPGSEADLRRRQMLTSSAERYEDELWWRRREPGFDLGGPTWAWLRRAFLSISALAIAPLEQIRTPILLLASGRDRLVALAAIRKVARRLPAAELHVYPQAGHEILRESDAVRLDALKRIDEFLERQAR